MLSSSLGDHHAWRWWWKIDEGPSYYQTTSSWCSKTTNDLCAVHASAAGSGGITCPPAAIALVLALTASLFGIDSRTAPSQGSLPQLGCPRFRKKIMNCAYSRFWKRKNSANDVPTGSAASQGYLFGVWRVSTKSGLFSSTQIVNLRCMTCGISVSSSTLEE